MAAVNQILTGLASADEQGDAGDDDVELPLLLLRRALHLLQLLPAHWQEGALRASQPLLCLVTWELRTDVREAPKTTERL